ncbi:MAG: tetratricopeptide repeat protein [Flavobacteriales bacterium]|nr:tetratricopeptide repeat protein [Flavobacteriales bacterium]
MAIFDPMLRVVVGAQVALCFLLMIVSIDQVVGQATAVFQSENVDFVKGKNLFDHKKYVAAQKYFEKAMVSYGNQNTLQSQDAELYFAICAYELFNRDGEQLLLEFRNSHPENPDIQYVNFVLGSLKYRNRKFKEALAWFEKVDIFRLTNDQIAECHFKKGYSNLKLRKNDDAKASFFEIKNSDTKYTPLAIYYYGHLSYEDKKYETALIEFRKLAADKNFGKIVPYYITQIYYLQEKFDEVLTYAPALLDTAKPRRSADISRLIADSYYKQSNFKEATPYFEKFLKLTNKITREDYYQMGYSQYKTGKYKDAISNFKKLLYQKDSLTQYALYHAASCYLKLDNKKFAKNAFSASAKMTFDDKIREDALFNFAKLSYESKYNPFREAITAFEDFIAQYPNSKKLTKAYEYLVNAYLTTKNYSAALQSLEKVKNKDVQLQTAYQMLAFNRGVELFNDVKIKDALVHFNKALGFPLDKSINVRAHYWKAESFYKLGRYEESISAYEAYYQVPGAASSVEFVKAHYNQGYAFFQKKDYASAILRLRQFVKKVDSTEQTILADAYLRIADSYFISKDNNNAVEYYDLALSNGVGDQAYAIFQKSMGLGVLRKFDEKIAALKLLIGKYEKSKLIDDAEFQLASSLLLTDKPQEARVYFSKIVNEYPNSSYVKKSLLKMAVIDYNNNKDAEALALYKRVVIDYKGFPEANIAFGAIEKIFVGNSDIEGWTAYLTSVSADISKSRLDSATYHSAENRYIYGDCDKTVQDFDNYIAGFPNGIFMLHANFYRAECLVKLNKAEQSLSSYAYVLNQVHSDFYEKALRRSADINFDLAFYNEANDQYIELEHKAEYNENVLAAKIGQMRAGFKLEKYDVAIALGNLLLGTDKITQELIEECHITIAKSALATDDFSLAMKEFKFTTDHYKTAMGAEAQFNVAYIQFLQKDYDLADSSITQLINQVPSYGYWVSKGLVLLSDIYMVKDDAMNGKYLLESVIENTADSLLLVEAQNKLIAIVEREAKEREKPVVEIIDDVEFEGSDLFDDEEEEEIEIPKKKESPKAVIKEEVIVPVGKAVAPVVIEKKVEEKVEEVKEEVTPKAVIEEKVIVPVEKVVAPIVIEKKVEEKVEEQIKTESVDGE